MGNTSGKMGGGNSRHKTSRNGAIAPANSLGPDAGLSFNNPGFDDEQPTSSHGGHSNWVQQSSSSLASYANPDDAIGPDGPPREYLTIGGAGASSSTDPEALRLAQARRHSERAGDGILPPEQAAGMYAMSRHQSAGGLKPAEEAGQRSQQPPQLPPKAPGVAENDEAQYLPLSAQGGPSAVGLYDIEEGPGTGTAPAASMVPLEGAVTNSGRASKEVYEPGKALLEPKDLLTQETNNVSVGTTGMPGQVVSGSSAPGAYESVSSLAALSNDVYASTAYEEPQRPTGRGDGRDGNTAIYEEPLEEGATRDGDRIIELPNYNNPQSLAGTVGSAFAFYAVTDLLEPNPEGPEYVYMTEETAGTFVKNSGKQATLVNENFPVPSLNSLLRLQTAATAHNLRGGQEVFYDTAGFVPNVPGNHPFVEGNAYDLASPVAGESAARVPLRTGGTGPVVVADDALARMAREARRGQDAAQKDLDAAQVDLVAMQRELAWLQNNASGGQDTAAALEDAQRDKAALADKLAEAQGNQRRPLYCSPVFWFCIVGVLGTVAAAVAVVLTSASSDQPEKNVTNGGGVSSSTDNSTDCAPFALTLLNTVLPTVREGVSALSLEDMFSMDFSEASGDFFMRFVLPLAAGALWIQRGAEVFKPGANGVVDVPVAGNVSDTTAGLKLHRSAEADTDGARVPVRVLAATHCDAEGEQLAEANSTFTLKINPRVQTPVVTSALGEDEILSSPEGARLNLESLFTVPAPSESDESQQVDLGGFPQGTQFIKSGRVLATADKDGNAAITSSQGVKVQLPQSFGAFTVSAKAVRQDGPAVATSATVSRSLTLTPVAKTPEIKAIKQSVPTAERATPQQLLLTNLVGVTLDAGQNPAYELKGAPIGSTLIAADGSKISDINSAGTTVPFSGELTGVSLELPAHFDDAFDFSLRGRSERGGVLSAWSNFVDVTVPMQPVSDGLGVQMASTAVVGEGQVLDISALVEAITPIDPSESRFEYLLSGLPAGVTLRQNANPLTAVDGAYALSVLDGLKAEVPEGTPNFAVAIQGRTTAENAQGTKATPSDWSAKVSTAVTVAGVAQGATATAKGPVTVNEGMTVRLTDLFDVVQADKDETLVRQYTGLPRGTRVERDGKIIGSAPSNGIVTLTGDAREALLLVNKHFKGDFNVGLRVQTQEADGSLSAFSEIATTKVTYLPVAEGVEVTAPQSTHGLLEDAIVDISALFTAGDISDSTEVPTFEIGGLPEGTVVSRNGGAIGTAGVAGTVVIEGAFDNITAKLPQHYQGAFDLSVRGKTKDGLIDSGYGAPASVRVTASPVSDGADLTVSSTAITGTMLETVSLKGKIGVTLKDPRETATLRFTNLPSGAKITDGVLSETAATDGASTAYRDWDLGNVQITFADKVNVAVGVEVRTQDGAATPKTSAATLNFAIKSNQETLTVQPKAINGDEDQIQDLGDLGIQYTGDGGVASLKIEIKMKDGSDLPAIEVKDKNNLSYKPGNTGNPKVMQLFVAAGAPWKLTPPKDYFGDLEFQVVVTGAGNTVTADLPATLAPVVDPAILSQGEMKGRTWVRVTFVSELQGVPLLDIFSSPQTGDVVTKEQICELKGNGQRSPYLRGGALTNEGNGCFSTAPGGFRKNRGIQYVNAPSGESSLEYTVWTRGISGDETTSTRGVIVKADRWCDTNSGTYFCPS